MVKDSWWAERGLHLVENDQGGRPQKEHGKTINWKGGEMIFSVLGQAGDRGPNVASLCY